MKILSITILIVVAVTACSNVKEFEKGEIQVVKMIKEMLLSSKNFCFIGYKKGYYSKKK